MAAFFIVYQYLGSLDRELKKSAESSSTVIALAGKSGCGKSTTLLEGIEYNIVKSTQDVSIVKLNISGLPTIVVKGHPSGQFINTTKAIVPLN